MATSAKAWREAREKGVELALPEYGDVVLIRPMDAEFFFRSGNIPDFLTPTVRKIINNEKYLMPSPDPGDEKTKEWLDWLDNLIRWTFVSPKVVDNPQADDEIGIDEIGYTDKMFVYLLFGRPANFLRGFRKSKDDVVAPVDDAQNNGANAKSDAGDKTLVKPIVGDA